MAASRCIFEGGRRCFSSHIRRCVGYSAVHALEGGTVALGSLVKCPLVLPNLKFCLEPRYASSSTACVFSSGLPSSIPEDNTSGIGEIMPFRSITDEHRHWLPLLAAELRKHPKFSRVAAAAKGESTSADPEALMQVATQKLTRLGLKVPDVAVVVFQAKWNAASADLLRRLRNSFSGLAERYALELVSVCSDSSPQLLQVYGVSSIPHCMLLINGQVASELPAGASAARHEAFVRAANEAADSCKVGIVPTESCGGNNLLNELESAVKTTGPRNHKKIQALLQKMAEEASLPKLHPTGRIQLIEDPRKLGKRYQKSPGSSPTQNQDKSRNEPSGYYFLDTDGRASRLAALGIVALFDAQDVSTKSLQGLEEALSQAVDIARGSTGTHKPKEAPPLPAASREALVKVLNVQEPQWSIDDCPTVRSLPLFNQLTLCPIRFDFAALNANLFSKARGAKPPRTGTAPVSPTALKTLEAPLWQLTEWLARVRRCLASRLFFESSETDALKLAATSHSDWLSGATMCNYMELSLAGSGGGSAEASSKACQDTTHAMARGGKQSQVTTGVHPLDVFSEPRAPSPGRALLSSMYTALGPDDPRVQQSFAEFDVSVNAHEFYPTKFSHTKARRGGKPRMMRGRSGRWFWLGPYWKPPWAPKRRSFVESWHLTNVTA